MYKGPSGMWAWLLHRLSGLFILLFLLIHIVDVSLLSFGPAVYNETIQFFDYFIARFLTLGLIGVVLFHAFNGVRIMLIDFWRKGVHYQRLMFVCAMALAVLGVVFMGYFVILPLLPLHPPTTTVH